MDEANIPRKTLSREVDSIYISDEKIVDIIEQLKMLVDSHGTEAKIEKRYYCGANDSYLAVVVDRLETDYEYEQRLADIKRAEEYERQ